MFSSLRSLSFMAIAFSSLLVPATLSAAETPAPQAPAGLRCEYLADPMGVDALRPRFFWTADHPERGQSQSAYQLVVSTLQDAVDGNVWDSGKTASATSIQVVYGGKQLESGRTYYWKVRWWDRDGRESPWSRTAAFDTGLYERADWKGQWIGGK